MNAAPGPARPAALILAAGFSRRLGRPKQAILFQGTTLLERTIRTAQEAALHPVVVVVHDPSWKTLLQDHGVTVLGNPNAQEGMSTSVHAGILELERHPVPGVVIMACDQPALHAGHLRALCADPMRITGSRYAERTGVPAYFPAAVFPELLQVRGDSGARNLLQQAAFVTEEALALDIDTEDDLDLARQRFAPEMR